MCHARYCGHKDVSKSLQTGGGRPLSVCLLACGESSVSFMSKVLWEVAQTLGGGDWGMSNTVCIEQVNWT